MPKALFAPSKEARASNSSVEFENCTKFYPGQKANDHYFERTKRNHFWFGGKSNQEQIRQLKIGVAGLGGMGSNIAEALARMGVGHLRIADPDHIDVSNINRQVIANTKTVGKSKAAASAEELKGIATDLELVVYEQGVSEEMVEEFVEGCDAIVDEIDVFPLNYHVMLHRAANKRNIPIYSSYVVGLGIHFYKFHGNDYTFEDFLNVSEAEWKKPTIELIYNSFGHPLPDYLDGRLRECYKNEAKENGVPIFGPSTLLGHSLVATRLILDLMRERMEFKDRFPLTPTMPEFLVLDPVDFTFKTVKMKI
jgi:molybdopterin/thiamine biosynthesis adenylyltransferase